MTTSNATGVGETPEVATDGAAHGGVSGSDGAVDGLGGAEGFGGDRVTTEELPEFVPIGAEGPKNV